MYTVDRPLRMPPPWRANPYHDKGSGQFTHGPGGSAKGKDLGPRFGLTERDFDSEPMHRSFPSSVDSRYGGEDPLDSVQQIRAAEYNWSGIGKWFGTQSEAGTYGGPGIVTVTVRFRKSDVAKLVEPTRVSGLVAPARTPVLVTAMTYTEDYGEANKGKRHQLDVPKNLITMTEGIEDDEIRSGKPKPLYSGRGTRANDLLTGTFAEQRRQAGVQERFNKAHDPKSGQFTGHGGMSAVKGALHTGTHEGEISEKARKAVAANLKKHGLTQEGIESELEKSLTPSNVVLAKRWYPDAHKYARGVAAKHGVSMEQAVGVISAVSPRTPWPRNQFLAERILSQHKKYADLTPEEAAARIGGGFRTNLALGVRIARGDSVDSALTGVKRRCFYNNILAPTKTESVTVDTWMQRAVMRSAKKEMDLDTAQDFIGASKAATGGVGAGYISIAEAARAVADRHGLSPDEVQSAYWISVSGSTGGGRPGA